MSKKIIKKPSVVKEDVSLLKVRELVSFEKLLKLNLLKKYPWFKNIELYDVSFSTSSNYLGFKGKIYVDSDWAGHQWRHYHYDTPMDEYFTFGDIIGGRESVNLQEDIKKAYSLVTGQVTPRYTSFSWLETVLVDDNLEEQISRIHEMIDKNSLNKKRDSFQRLVENGIKNIKSRCDEGTEDDEYVTGEACNLINAGLQVTVTDVKSTGWGLSILMVIKYRSYNYIDSDWFEYELKDELRKTIGQNIMVEIEDSINTFPPSERQW